MTTEKRTVLVVDDEEMLRSLMCDILEGEGFSVLSAGNGREAVDIYTARGNEIALVVMDMSMPEMDGTQTFTVLQEMDPAVKVLVSSGYAEDPHVKKLLERGALGVIPKPFKVDDLARTVEQALGR